ncbi:uncharacterized protein LOC123895800 [Trifolium pratense]|uniref:uncharacterized protein LOC123895800 n=1 Tax=Trifolium pratense TaxID=57577 RepID=UPI001E694BF9|nr:uncharacterized protein LOC123895800 [Trifolium pratense]
MASPKLTKYERMRLENIRINKEMMATLNVQSKHFELYTNPAAVSSRGSKRGGRSITSRGRCPSSRGKNVLQDASPLLPNSSLIPTPTPDHTQTPTPSPTTSSPTPTPLPTTTSTPTPTTTSILISSPTQLPTTPTPTPLPSHIPQSLEQTQQQTQSSDIESQDDHVDQECLPEIMPYGNEFNPSSAVRFLTAAIKSKFDWYCPTWGKSTKDMRDLWFNEFKKYCTWEPKYEARICQIFDIKGDARFRGIMYQERFNYVKDPNYKPKYMSLPIWNQLKHYWATDKKYKNLSVANTINRASNEGSSMHTGGSISMGEHARRMEEATGIKPTFEEMFAKCHMKQNKSWVDNRAKNAFEGFKKRKTELSELSLTQNENGEGLSHESQLMPDEMTIWKEVVHRGKKGKLYGLGSLGSNISSKPCTSSFSFASKETNLEQELVKWQEKVKEQELENLQQKSKLEAQQKRIESTESMLVTLFGKLNMPLLQILQVELP